MEQNSVTSDVVVYIGPTLERAYLTADPLIKMLVLPPVKRGDIDKLLDRQFKGTIIIVDGYFHSQPSVGHSEILKALREGCNIWGLSSMGAIRAYEMSGLGMKGYGRVFECFKENDDFMDDEVSLLHASAPPYKHITEPMVNIRYFLSHLLSRCEITEELYSKILNTFKEKYYGERYLRDLASMLAFSIPPKRVESYIRNFNDYRIKRIDCIEFFRCKGWQ